MPRIIFTDKLMRSGHGHHLEYCLRLVGAFAAKGYQAVFLANRDFKGARPPGLRPVIAFDFNRVILGQEERAKRKLQKQKTKRLRNRQMRERFHLSPPGIAHLAINEMRRGAQMKSGDRALMFGAFLFGSAALAMRILAVTAWVATWPVRVTARILRRIGGRLARTSLAAGLKARFALLGARLGVKEPLRLLRILLVSRNPTEETLVKSLGRAISNLSPTADDIILCTTTVQSDLKIYLEVLKRYPRARIPHWHFVFREPIFLNQGPGYVIGQDQRGLRTSLIAFEAMKDVRSGWWVDTVELAEQYSHLGVFEFGALPIPMPDVLSSFVEDPLPRDRPLTIGYLGDARQEKGYPQLSSAMRDLAARKRHWLNRIGRLADLADEEARALALPNRPTADSRGAMLKRRTSFQYQLERKRIEIDPIDTLQGAPRFAMLAQSNFNVPEGTSQTRAERYRLMAQDDIGVELILKPPTSAEYVENVRRTDLFMLNYRHPLYHAGSSGVFAEAMMAGRPTVVSDDTWGGRRLRSSPQYISHLKGLIADRASFEIKVSPIEHASDGVAWRVLPAKISHVASICEFDFSAVTDQLAWIAEFRTAEGKELVRRRLLCNREGAAAAIIAVPPGAAMVRSRVERLNPQLLPSGWNMKSFGLDLRTFDVPLSAVGVVVSEDDEIAPALAEIGRHYAHYRTSAQSFAVAWAQENDAALLAEKVVGHARGHDPNPPTTSWSLAAAA
jgi:hypothetical protein